jgi:hypothetical protein
VNGHQAPEGARPGTLAKVSDPKLPAGRDDTADRVAAARSRVNKIRSMVEDVKVLIVEAWENRDWIALGYDTWDLYCTTEFGASVAIPRDERAELVFHLRDHGMSLRAIEQATGISKDTAARDLSTVADETVETVTGVNGKAYKAKSAPVEEVVSEPDAAEHMSEFLWAQLLSNTRSDDLEEASRVCHEAGDTSRPAIARELARIAELRGSEPSPVSETIDADADVRRARLLKQAAKGVVTVRDLVHLDPESVAISVAPDDWPLYESTAREATEWFGRLLKARNHRLKLMGDQ